MDTSETYSKMSGQARKIQEDHDFEIGDWVLFMPPHDGVLRAPLRVLCANPNQFTKGRDIWLPRQDELQKMIETLESASEIAKAFGDWCYSNLPQNISDTMEQLWLAFVMKQNFNQTWDGSDWG